MIMYRIRLMDQCLISHVTLEWFLVRLKFNKYRCLSESKNSIICSLAKNKAFVRENRTFDRSSFSTIRDYLRINFEIISDIDSHDFTSRRSMMFGRYSMRKNGCNFTIFSTISCIGVGGSIYINYRLINKFCEIMSISL